MNMANAGRAELAATFRDAMAGVCTAVSVVTAMDGERPHGTTVSAFASLSMAPPMVLVALDRGSELLALVRAEGRFGLNVLGADQASCAARFARKGQDKFAVRAGPIPVQPARCEQQCSEIAVPRHQAISTLLTRTGSCRSSLQRDSNV